MDIRLPKLGEGADTGTVVTVMVKEGDPVRKDQPLIEIESEKAVATIPSPEAGTVQKLHVQPGQTITVGQLILSLSGGASAQTGTSAPALEAPAANAMPAATVPAPAARPVVDVSGVSLAAIPDSIAMPAAPPSVRFMAAQLGLDLRRISSLTGRQRVGVDDLRHYVDTLQKLAAKADQPAVPSAENKPVAESIDFSQWGPVLKKPLTQLRKVIGRRMTENWQAIPHVTQFDEVDMTTILHLRKKHLAAYEKKGVKLTVTPFIIKAVVSTLQRHLLFNSSLDEAAGEIILKEYFHLGLAVDTEAGLYVPVLRDADRKDMLTLSEEVATLAAKARDRKLGAEDMKGGTFSISNQGAFGGAHFTPIVNRPEVAILGLGRSADRAAVRDGKVVVRPLMPIALSYDHRVIDGGAAARFTVDLVQAFEQFDESLVKL
ncbi:MAG: 2-oxo acid dehydrogenase subunit E2 [Verrucomicrobiales bacterium]|nr:2-oxo acid dehydrogenase subunit E2 [Akkermansiaceae bacterium]